MSCLSAILVLALVVSGIRASPDEVRLLDDVLHDHEINKMVIPIYNSSEHVQLKFGISLIDILKLDETNEILEAKLWIKHLWSDYRFTWDPSEYGGVDKLRIPIDKIWKPDVMLYNSANTAYDESGLGQVAPSHALVFNTGEVLYIIPSVTKVRCSMDLRDYPNGTQYCSLNYGSWTYDGFKLDIDFYEGHEDVDLSDYITSNKWDLVAHSGRKNVKYYPCCVEPYPDLTYTLQLRRRSAK